MIGFRRRKTAVCIIAAVVALPLNLRPYLLGEGALRAVTEGSFQLALPPIERGYADAQVDDYQGLARSDFSWSPPLQLSLRARASHPAPAGTLGFGFWNDPFSLALGGSGGARRLPAAPQALWYFYGSEPTDFSFGDGTGVGWRAACIRSPRLPAWVLAPGAAAAFALAAVPGVRIPVVRLIKRSIGGAEVPLEAALDQWHLYQIRWTADQVRFEVDRHLILSSSVVPRPPLGFVAWIDNQYAVLSARRGIRFGTLPTHEPAWLEIAELQIERG